MKVEIREACDVCRRELPVLRGSVSKRQHVRIFKRTIWRFFSNRLSWAKDRREDVAICGDCWERLGEAVERA
jgi:hypothetical protein